MFWKEIVHMSWNIEQKTAGELYAVTQGSY